MSTLAEMMAAKKAARVDAPPTELVKTADAVPAVGADLGLQQGASYNRRLLDFAQRLALQDKSKEINTLNELADMVTEILRMEEAQIGTAWNQVDRTKFDLPVLGEAMRLLRDRFNDYSPAICDSLLAGKSKRLLALSNGEDPRHLGHVIAAAAQVIAEQEMVATTKKDTRNKRETRLTEAQKIASVESDSAFDALFGAEDIFMDGTAQNKDAANGLETSTTSGDSADAADPFDFEIGIDDTVDDPFDFD